MKIRSAASRAHLQRGSSTEGPHLRAAEAEGVRLPQDLDFALGWQPVLDAEALRKGDEMGRGIVTWGGGRRRGEEEGMVNESWLRGAARSIATGVACASQPEAATRGLQVARAAAWPPNMKTISRVPAHLSGKRRFL